MSKDSNGKQNWSIWFQNNLLFRLRVNLLQIAPENVTKKYFKRGQERGISPALYLQMITESNASAAYVKEVRNEYWAYNFWNTQTNQLVLQRRWESRLGSNLCYRNENVRSSKQLLALPARHLLHQRMLGKFPPHASLQFLQKRLSEILHKTSVTPYFVIW